MITTIGFIVGLLLVAIGLGSLGYWKNWVTPTCIAGAGATILVFALFGAMVNEQEGGRRACDDLGGQYVQLHDGTQLCLSNTVVLKK